MMIMDKKRGLKLDYLSKSIPMTGQTNKQTDNLICRDAPYYVPASENRTMYER